MRRRAAIEIHRRGSGVPRAACLPVFPALADERPVAPDRFDGGAPRAGSALLVVVLILAVTFALSYSVMRSQGTALLIQHNAGLQGSARQAAETGLRVAIQKMHTAQWAGVDTTLSGTLGQHDSFAVKFTTGDGSLAASDADYWEYPYRVTLVSTGRAADPDNPARAVTHKMRAVVRLVPRKLTSVPAGFSDVTGFTLCQWTSGASTIQAPCRIEGKTRWRSTMVLALSDIPWSSDARWQYLSDLNAMRLAGRSDWRIFNNTVRLYYSWQYADTVTVLNQAQGVSTTDSSTATLYAPPAVGDAPTYRLYPGGKTYSAQLVDRDLQNTTLAPNPATNPLGVFARAGEIRLLGNVTIRGTLLATGSTGDILVTGTGVRVEPPTNAIMPLAGTSTPIQLPVLVCGDDLVFATGSKSTVSGLALAADNFEVQSDSQAAMQVDIRGRVAARDVLIRPRSDWVKTALFWLNTYNSYSVQKSWGIRYFPDWLKQKEGLDPTPRITIVPESTTVQYHWQGLAEPLYVPDPSDATALDPTNPGLRWELIEWTDNP